MREPVCAAGADRLHEPELRPKSWPGRTPADESPPPTPRGEPRSGESTSWTSPPAETARVDDQRPHPSTRRRPCRESGRATSDDHQVNSKPGGSMWCRQPCNVDVTGVGQHRLRKEQQRQRRLGSRGGEQPRPSGESARQNVWGSAATETSRSPYVGRTRFADDVHRVRSGTPRVGPIEQEVETREWKS